MSSDHVEEMRQLRIRDLEHLGHKNAAELIGNHEVCQGCEFRNGDCIMVALCPLAEEGMCEVEDDDPYYDDFGYNPEF